MLPLPHSFIKFIFKPKSALEQITVFFLHNRENPNPEQQNPNWEVKR